MKQAWVIIGLFLLVLGCAKQAPKPVEDVYKKTPASRTGTLKAPVVTPVATESLHTVVPGQDGVPPPERERARHTRKNPVLGAKPIRPGKSMLPQSKAAFQRGEKPVRSQPPEVIPAQEPLEVFVMQDSTAMLQDDSLQGRFRTYNPTTTNSMRPPRRYVVPGQKTHPRKGEKKYSVQHNDTLYPPRQVVPTILPPQPAGPMRFKDRAIFDIQALETVDGLASPYILSVAEGPEGGLWLGSANGLIKYDGNQFYNFTIHEGLPHNYVRDLEVDRHGMLWGSTWGGGVFRYDGQKFTVFTKRQGLADNNVKSVHEDKEGNLWFGTLYGGVSKFDGEGFTNYTDFEGLNSSYVLSIDEDSKGNLWFGTYFGGISRFDGEKFYHYTTEQGLAKDRVLTVYVDDEDNLWLGTDGAGVQKFDGRDFINYTTAQGLSHNVVRTVYQDRQGRMWFGTWGGGLTCLEDGKLMRYAVPEGLSNNYVRTVYQGSKGMIWVGTEGGGLNKINPGSFSHYTTEQGLLQNTVWSVYEDSNDMLWIGSWEGGASRFDGATFTHFTREEGLSGNSVKSICEDEQGRLWFGTRGKGLTRYDGEFFTHFTREQGLGYDYVTAIHPGKAGEMWFGTFGGGLCHYNGEGFTTYGKAQGLSDNRVVAIEEDAGGQLWLGTHKGLNRYDGDNFAYYGKKQGLGAERINAVYQDSRQVLWVCTYGGGVSRLQDGHFETFSTASGLSHPVVYSVVEDDRHRLWFSTKNGLSVLLPEEAEKAGPRFIALGHQDGLKAVDSYINDICVDHKGRLWWGTQKALTKLDLGSFSISRQAPRAKLDRIAVKGQYIDFRHLAEVDLQENQQSFADIVFDSVAAFRNFPVRPEFPSGLDHIRFHFSATDWGAPHKIRYSYKLEGLDTRWSQPKAEPSADYRNLPYGKYKFFVKAMGISGHWGEPLSYPFEVAPPWWQTWWARLLAFFILVVLLLAAHRWQVLKLRRRQKMLEKMVEERTYEIRQKNIKLNQQKEEIFTQADSLKKANKSLNVQNRRLEELNDEKNSLMRVVAHDLKSPLNNIYSFAQLIEMETTGMGEEAVGYLKMIYKIIEGGNSLIQDLLDIHAIEGYQTATDYQALDVEAFLKDVVHAHERYAEQKEIKLVQKAKLSRRQFYIDKGHLERIINNLISNAIKFSPFGAHVWVQARETDDTLEIAVKDEGPGFTEEDKEKVFQKFKKLSARPTNDENSTGLGLSIVKTLVERLDGTIHLHSAAGKGSTFVIRIPWHNAPGSPGQESQAPHG